ncbi:uncharacterized protein WCC33_013392 [Rhinophrynus dorsalis]
MVLECLRSHRLYVKLEKCDFEQPFLPFRGYVVSSSGVYMDTAKLAAVKDWPHLTTLRDVQRFIWFTSYYWKFIRGFFRIIQPIVSLTSKGADPGRWSLEAVTAFQTLKGLHHRGG